MKKIILFLTLLLPLLAFSQENITKIVGTKILPKDYGGSTLFGTQMVNLNANGKAGFVSVSGVDTAFCIINSNGEIEFYSSTRISRLFGDVYFSDTIKIDETAYIYRDALGNLTFKDGITGEINIGEMLAASDTLNLSYRIDTITGGFIQFSDTSLVIATKYNLDTLTFLRSYTETDPIYSGDSVKIVWFSDTVSAIATKYNLDTLTFLRSYTETDPIYSGDSVKIVWFSDTVSTIATKYNLDTLTFLRSYTETDPIYSGDSVKIVWFSDTVSTIATQYDISSIPVVDTTNLDYRLDTIYTFVNGNYQPIGTYLVASDTTNISDSLRLAWVELYQLDTGKVSTTGGDYMYGNLDFINSTLATDWGVLEKGVIVDSIVKYFNGTTYLSINYRLNGIGNHRNIYLPDSSGTVALVEYLPIDDSTSITYTTDTLYIDREGAHVAELYSDADTLRLESSKVIKIGDNSLVVETNGNVITDNHTVNDTLYMGGYKEFNKIVSDLTANDTIENTTIRHLSTSSYTSLKTVIGNSVRMIMPDNGVRINKGGMTGMSLSLDNYNDSTSNFAYPLYLNYRNYKGYLNGGLNFVNIVNQPVGTDTATGNSIKGFDMVILNRSNAGGRATMVDSYGFRLAVRSVTNAGYTSTTNTYGGHFILDGTNTGGTLLCTNARAINITGTLTTSGEHYGIYQDWGNYNYFNGKIGMNVTVPTATLQVKGEGHAGSTTPFLIEDDLGTDLVTVNDTGYVNLSNSINIASTRAYKQNGVNLIRVPATSSTSLCIGNSGNQTFTGAGNIYMGTESGEFSVAGTRSIGIGERSLRYSLGNYNIGIGGYAGYGNLAGTSTGTYNTFIGYESGYSYTTADYSVGLGANTLKFNTTGDNNIAIGYSSLTNNVGGNYNTAIGSSTMTSNVSGNMNVAIGMAALTSSTGNYNTSVGFQSFTTLSSGANNTGLGFRAGNSNSTGGNNVFVGYNCGYSNLGSGSVFMGYQAGYNETGSNKLYIENSNSATPLIYGDFASDYISINGQLNTQNVYPITNDTYYLGKNDDDTPSAYKGLILKDTTNGNYYRIEIINGVITATDLTD